jgi:hypothetical protein
MENMKYKMDDLEFAPPWFVGAMAVLVIGGLTFFAWVLAVCL